MGHCQLCKREVDMPFTCSYCGQTFCSEHRLPENHLCPNLPKTRSWSQYQQRYTPKQVKIGPITPQKDPPAQPKITKSEKSGSKAPAIIFIAIFVVIIGYLLSGSYNVVQPDENRESPPEIPSQVQKEKQPSEDYTYQELIQLTLDVINEERSQRGLANVTLSDVPSAQSHADNMLGQGFYSHWGLDGKKPYMRYFDAGGVGVVSENIGYSYNSGGLNKKDAITRLMNNMMYDDEVWDWGHRDNIIDSRHNKVAIGLAYSFTKFYMVQDFEDAYIEEQTLNQNRNTIHLIVDSSKPNWIPSHILVYYDAYPEPISKDRITFSPYNGSYSFGEYIGGVVPKNHYMKEGFTIEADYWVTTQYNHEARFDLTPMFTEYGSGVYTLCIIEENEFWNTICIYHLIN